jgi:hypothetical protein
MESSGMRLLVLPGHSSPDAAPPTAISCGIAEIPPRIHFHNDFKIIGDCGGLLTVRKSTHSLGAMPDLASSIALLSAGFIAGWFAGVICHETGHVLGATAAGFPVYRVSFGVGPVLLRRRLNETWFELRLHLWNGIVLVDPGLSFRKYASMLFVAGGVLGNLTLLTVLALVLAAVPVTLPVQDTLVGVAIAQLSMMAGTLVPSRCKLQGVEYPSDGRQLLDIARERRPDPPTPVAVAMAALLHPYFNGREPVLPAPEAVARIWRHLGDPERWTRADIRRETDAGLVRELHLGGLPRELELLVLDAVMTNAVMFSDPELRPYLDDWSRRALELAPDLATLRGTRGAALAELGRYAEAKPMLEPLVTADGSDMDLVLSRIFLARAEHNLGDSATARRLVDEARAICKTKALSPAVVQLVERGAHEVGNGDTPASA